MVPHSVHQVMQLIFNVCENFKDKEKCNRYLLLNLD